ncbi:MAG: DNA repair protein RadC [Chloroflexi bacterium]|nr:DNA repair protein RadC [Chloroflexota bacterium]
MRENTAGESALRIGDLPATERPRERFLQVGPAASSQRELLAILLRTGAGAGSALSLADDLLARFGGLAGLARTPVNELTSVHGIGPVKAIEIKAAFELGKRAATATPEERPQIRTPGDAAQLLMYDMGVLEQEEVRALLLDTRNRVLAAPMICRGSLNSASLRIADLFKEAIRTNAAAVVVAHNHPSGDPSPSQDDIHVTREMVKAGKILEIDVLDHLVIGHNRFVSLKEKGLMGG